MLGSMLFRGEELSRQPALGLFWLIVAKDGAAPEETWITEMYASAIAQANESERNLAHKYLEDWLKRRILLPPSHTASAKLTNPRTVARTWGERSGLCRSATSDRSDCGRKLA